MLIVCQFPVCDAREFTSARTSRLNVPPFPLPSPGSDFVRCFGQVKRRRQGGHETFPDEVFYSSAQRAVKFDHLENRSFGREPSIFKPVCEFRRLFCNGSPVVRLEVGLTDDAVGGGVGGGFENRQSLSIALGILELPVQVTQFKADAVSCPLWRAGKPIADLYASATTETASDSHQAGHHLVIAGEPLLLIEYEDHEIASLPDGVKDIASEQIGGAKLSFIWLEYRRRQFGLWYLRNHEPHDRVQRALIRRLRLGLLRLHAEHQALKHTLSLLSKGAIEYAPHTELSNAFDSYLNVATRTLLSADHAGFSSAAIRDVIAAYQLIANPDELNLLEQRLDQVRRQVRLKIKDYIKPSPVLPEPPKPEPGDSIRCFISYSHQDSKYLESNSLAGFLSGLEKERFDFWNDGGIETGQIWDQRIRDEIEKTNIAILLISQAFLNSHYSQEVEVTNFLEAMRKRGLIIYPIILSPCDWKSHSWLKALQFQPRNETIETAFKDSGKRKHLYLTILEELRNIGKSIRSKRRNTGSV